MRSTGGLAVGEVVNAKKMAKHLALNIGDGHFSRSFRSYPTRLTAGESQRIASSIASECYCTQAGSCPSTKLSCALSLRTLRASGLLLGFRSGAALVPSADASRFPISGEVHQLGSGHGGLLMR